MITTLRSLGAVILGGGLFISGCANKQPTSFQSLKNPELAAQLKSFIAEKEAQANAATNKMPSEFQAFFAVAAKGDWLAVSNAFIELRNAGPYEHSGKTDGRLRGTAWQAVLETRGALEAFGEGDEKYSMIFGTNIIASIQAGSIYFGGTDAGRFIITALQKSHVRAEPFFTLTQGALPDARYLEYLRGMYGAKIHTPTDEDSKRTLQDYSRDFAQRRSKNQLLPGEDITVGADGQIQFNGQMAVIQIKALLAKLLFDKNPDREFYIEESFPFDWMYPYLEPHGLIFKINHQPLPGLSDKSVQQDHAYWRSLVRPMIGDWLSGDTLVDKIAAFAKKTFGKQDFNGFAGDRRFIQNAYSHRMFSKLRSSHAGLYAWRMQHAIGAIEKERMAREADFAFRQAWALCPDSNEAVFRYVALLMEQKRVADALLVAETAAQMPSMQGQGGQQIRDLVVHLKQFQKAKQASSGGK
jgi:outer membrane murein-binding lipoprotein Lpp